MGSGGLRQELRVDAAHRIRADAAPRLRPAALCEQPDTLCRFHGLPRQSGARRHCAAGDAAGPAGIGSAFSVASQIAPPPSRGRAIAFDRSADIPSPHRGEGGTRAEGVGGGGGRADFALFPEERGDGSSPFPSLTRWVPSSPRGERKKGTLLPNAIALR